MKYAAFTDESITELVYRFYDRVRQDEVIGPVFEQMLAGRWEQHLPRMVDFWSTILVSSGKFQGNVYGKHMALSGITKEHFVRWLGLFRQTVRQLFEPEQCAMAEEVADRIAGSLQLGYFGERTVRIDAVPEPAQQSLP